MDSIIERKKYAKMRDEKRKATEAKVKELHKQGYSAYEIAEKVGIAEIFVLYILTDHFKKEAQYV